MVLRTVVINYLKSRDCKLGKYQTNKSKLPLVIIKFQFVKITLGNSFIIPPAFNSVIKGMRRRASKRMLERTSERGDSKSPQGSLVYLFAHLACRRRRGVRRLCKATF